MGIVPIIAVELIFTGVGSIVADHIKLFTEKLKFALYIYFHIHQHIPMVFT